MVTEAHPADGSAEGRAPDAPAGRAGHALAAVRIAIGLWFVKSMVTKLGIVVLRGIVPLPGANSRWVATMPKLVARYASENPIAWYKAFLLGTVVPNATIFAHLTALGETAVGIGLTLGLLTPLASVVAIVLVASYGLSNFWQGTSQQGFHYLLLVSLAACFVGRAGRWWSVDGWLRRHAGGRRLTAGVVGKDGAPTAR